MELDYSREAVLDFLAYLSDRGMMNKDTAVGRKAAARQMLEVLDDQEARDVRLVNLDELTSRFANLKGRKYNPQSIQIYRGRLQKTLEEFLRYREDPVSFRPNAPRAAKTIRLPRSKTSSATSDSPDASAKTSLVPYQNVTAAQQTQTISVPIAIRASCVVVINGLPVDLTESEASKIAAVVVAMGTG